MGREGEPVPHFSERETMRHPEREIRDQPTMAAVLRKAHVGRMATVNSKGIPVIKPVNFLYLDGRIYIHSSKKGEKVKDIIRGSPVCFEVDEPIAYRAAGETACKAGYYYRSIIVKGKASLVEDRVKKLAILETMMEKYQPEGNHWKFEESVLRKTAVIEIRIMEMTGKENLG
jgi:nitroimidazol reductase NimA-like FMN-containing flavoprotein (pyridoxamine 5'-phosphate oxidase superfamily)